MKKFESLIAVDNAIAKADNVFDEPYRQTQYLRVIALVARFWLQQQAEK